MRFPNLAQAFSVLHDMMRSAPLVTTERWQGVSTANRPEMATHELVQFYFLAPMPHTLSALVDQVKPNLPWADDHFAERVSGMPLNPPPSWKTWPWGHSASNFLDQRDQFNHTYPERFWPKYAGLTRGGWLPPNGEVIKTPQRTGIRYHYGDLGDVINLLEREPHTRQAYLPVWFPEDTGVVHKDRAPCTLGYHFLRRNDKLHVSYYIRSCDFTRHFADDVYLTVRLAKWVLEKLAERDDQNWLGVQLGNLAMHVGSMHMFRNDWLKEFGS